ADGVVGPVAALPHDDAQSKAAGLPFPMLPQGFGNILPDITDLSVVALTPYLVKAEKIATEIKSNPNEKTCDQLIGKDGAGVAGGLKLGTDYFKLGTVPKGTFTNEDSFLVALTGCLPAAASTRTPDAILKQCGSNYSAGTGNL